MWTQIFLGFMAQVVEAVEVVKVLLSPTLSFAQADILIGCCMLLFAGLALYLWVSLCFLEIASKGKTKFSFGAVIISGIVLEAIIVSSATLVWAQYQSFAVGAVFALLMSGLSVLLWFALLFAKLKIDKEYAVYQKVCAEREVMRGWHTHRE